MLIVYQSLESTGTKDDLFSTFITGNSFKRNVQESRPEESSFYKSRVWHNDESTFNTTKLKTPFATSEQSDKLSKTIKNLKSDEQEKKAIEILAKIVERIVDDASACTRPKGKIGPFVRRPDVIVLGEIYATSLKQRVLSGYVVIGGIDPTGDARHRFTVLVQTGLDGKNASQQVLDGIEPMLSVEKNTSNKDENSKCMLIKVRGWRIAFVHTPNSICNNSDRATDYLLNNAQRFGDGSRLDLVMGDTNQGTSHTVKDYMDKAYNRKSSQVRGQRKQIEKTLDISIDDDSTKEETSDKWDHSVMSSKKQVIRGYTNYEVSGTNSKYDKHFDIACTREAHVSLSGLTVHSNKDDDLTYHFSHNDQEPSFIFHGLTEKFVELDGCLYAYSDHNGVIVEVRRDKPDYSFTQKRKEVELKIEQFRLGKKIKMTELKPDEGKK
jgi:hypothetical protein